MVPLLRIEAADQPIPQLIPQRFQARPAPPNATRPVDAAKSGYPPNAQPTDYESAASVSATSGNS
jgi:hypothetical protein